MNNNYNKMSAFIPAIVIVGAAALFAALAIFVSNAESDRMEKTEIIDEILGNDFRRGVPAIVGDNVKPPLSGEQLWEMGVSPEKATQVKQIPVRVALEFLPEIRKNFSEKLREFSVGELRIMDETHLNDLFDTHPELAERVVRKLFGSLYEVLDSPPARRSVDRRLERILNN